MFLCCYSTGVTGYEVQQQRCSAVLFYSMQSCPVLSCPVLHVYSRGSRERVLVPEPLNFSVAIEVCSQLTNNYPSVDVAWGCVAYSLPYK